MSIELAGQNEIQLSKGNPIASLLQGIISSGLTPETAAVAEKMADLYLRMEAEQAKKEFAKAFAALQSDLPRVIAMKPVPNQDGSVRYTYAPLEDIMEQTMPAISAHGFSVRFSQSSTDKEITIICTVTHAAGHSETTPFTCRIGNGPPKASESQADGSASTYAKRFAFSNAFGVVIEKDNDARALGTTITPEQAKSLEARVAATGSDPARFLKLAAAESFDAIRSGKYSMLDALLLKKEKREEPTSLPNPSPASGVSAQTDAPPPREGRTTPSESEAWKIRMKDLASSLGGDDAKFEQAMALAIKRAKLPLEQTMKGWRDGIEAAIKAKNGFFAYLA